MSAAKEVTSREIFQNNLSVVNEKSIAYLPKEIILSLFSSLDLKTLQCCACVCKNWNEALNTPAHSSTFWENRFLKTFGKVKTDLLKKFYIQNNQLNWPQAFRYAPLSSFLDETIDDRYWNLNWEFSICNSTDVQVKSRRTDEIFILKGEEEQPLSRIVSDKDFVFALRFDGKIVQWNYSFEEIVQILETLYSVNDPKLEKSNLRYYGLPNAPEGTVNAESFDIINGKIIISWRLYYYGGKREDLFQTISYDAPSYNLSFTLKAEETDFLPKVTHMTDQKVYLQKSDEIIFFELKTKSAKTKNLEIGCFYSFFTEKSLFAFSDNEIHIYDIKNLVLTDKIPLGEFCTSNLKMLVHKNYLFGFSTCFANKDNFESGLLIWDLNSKKIVRTIFNLCDFRLYDMYGERDKDLLIELIDICRNPEIKKKIPHPIVKMKTNAS